MSATVEWDDAGCGHERGTSGGYVLHVIDLGGSYQWQLTEPRDGYGGYLTGGRVVVDGDRPAAKAEARRCAVAALESRERLLAEVAAVAS